jgi:hypothetical protein
MGRVTVANLPSCLQTTICWRLISAQRVVFLALFFPVVPSSGINCKLVKSARPGALQVVLFSASRSENYTHHSDADSESLTSSAPIVISLNRDVNTSETMKKYLTD